MPVKRRIKKGGDDTGVAPAYAEEHQALSNYNSSPIALDQVAGGGKKDNKKKGGFVNLAPFITALSLLGIKLLNDKTLFNKIIKNKKKGGGEGGDEDFEMPPVAPPAAADAEHNEATVGGGRKKRASTKKAASKKAAFKPKTKK